MSSVWMILSLKFGRNYKDNILYMRYVKSETGWRISYRYI